MSERESFAQRASHGVLVPFFPSSTIKMHHNPLRALPPEITISVGYVYATTMKSHKNVLNSDHVEQPLRIDHIYRALRRHGFISRMKKIDGRLATREEVLLVHTRGLWDKVQAFACTDLLRFTSVSLSHATTPSAALTKDEMRDKEDYYESMSLYVCPGTTRAARFSCGGVIEAALSVARGEVNRSFAIVRPPGHHAEPKKHMGFCFFNNVAIAAKVVQQRTPLKKIMIVDWFVFSVYLSAGMLHIYACS